jgi:hypothetical protein
LPKIVEKLLAQSVSEFVCHSNPVFPLFSLYPELPRADTATMANAEKSKLEVPWGTLLPLIAALAGIIVQYKPVVSERPPAPGEKAVEVVAEQDVDARLWQDPLAVVRRAKEAQKTEAKPNRTIDTLAQNIADRAKSDKPRHISRISRRSRRPSLACSTIANRLAVS